MDSLRRQVFILRGIHDGLDVRRRQLPHMAGQLPRRRYEVPALEAFASVAALLSYLEIRVAVESLGLIETSTSSARIDLIDVRLTLRLRSESGVAR